MKRVQEDTKEELFNKEEEKDNKVLYLVKSDRRGGDDEPPEMDCWLGKRPEGSCFYVQNNNTTVFTVALFRLAKKQGKVYILQMAKGDGLPEEVTVNPMRFCKQFSLYEDLGIISPKEEVEDERDRDDQDDDGEGSSVGEPAPIETEPQDVPEQH